MTVSPGLGRVDFRVSRPYSWGLEPSFQKPSPCSKDSPAPLDDSGDGGSAGSPTLRRVSRLPVKGLAGGGCVGSCPAQSHGRSQCRQGLWGP